MIAVRKLLIVLCLSGYVAEAYTPSIDHLHMSNKNFIVSLPNPSDDSRRAVLMELLGSDSPVINWPAFPRTWTQFTEVTTQETNTSYGFTANTIAGNLGIGGNGIPVQAGVTYKPYNITYRYSFETTLVAMSSYRGDNPSGKTILEATEPDMSTLFRLDPVLNRNFFNSSLKSPMVGFCIFEARVEISTSEEFGINYVIGSSSNIDAKSKVLRHALFSNFFQIESHVPVTDYLSKHCGENFRYKARPYIEADFNKLVVEMNIHHNPNNECIIEGEFDPAGDRNCLAWHKQNFPEHVQKSTVPRCVMGDKGISKCEIRSKEGSSCPLYLDRHGQYTEEWQLYRDATVTGYSYRCDDGLSCSMDKNPLRLHNFIFWPGYATCK